ncbi:sensor histidine kinase [Bartonella sp. A05]|uniref:sensor histidine kinase n=1 Tax=Bartonella sp. A05 TaxID=2967261 RepID=UPI0022A9B248|nr:PAS domain-containing sensor histidine kinase [Bartonella sp. A05]MCZ2203307.1 ATP-binding protein [Bartonella sp. A05]
MALAFLDYLECTEIRQAFIRGQKAFVISFDGGNILWSNGAAAYFFGFSSVADVVTQPPFLNQVVRHRILHSAQCASSVVLRGVKDYAEFSVISVDISGIGQAFLLEALRKEDVSLIAGLDDATWSVAIIDEHAIVQEASSHFCFVDATLKILLQTINDEISVKTVLPIAGINVHVGVIRLRVRPASFLVLCAQLDADDSDSSQKPFSFTPSLLPRRFIWKMDADGRFCEVSKELTETVGPISSRILGADFHRLAHQFSDERYRELGDFIKAATPWSEQKVQWPVDDCLERLDVELSALPVFDTKNRLKGFRGFGILKLQEKISNGKDKKLHTVPSNLSEIERLAFQEIAQRLRGELFLPVGKENFADELAVQLPREQTLPENMIAQVLMEEPEVVLSLLDTVMDGILWLDEQGFIQSASDTILALIDCKIDELLAQPLTSLFTLQSRALVEKYFELMRAKRTNQVLNWGEMADLVTKNHENITVSMMIVPLTKQDYYAVILRNMTDMTLPPAHKAEDNQMIEVVHEMQTPLNALIGFAEIMKDGRFGLIENKCYRKYLCDIVSLGQYILSLINQLLASSKENHCNTKNRNDTSLRVQAFDVTSYLRATIAFLETQANCNGIIMRIVAPVHVPFIRISQQIFRQIIWNLLSNAIRFTPSGGQIVIHVSDGGKERVKISISDNGIGMNDKEVVKALQPYDQIEHKDGWCGDGVFVETDLGLPLCKTVIEENGGQFFLFSKPNLGTTVEMFFPVFRE